MRRRRDKTVQLLREGFTPSKIAKEMKMTHGAVISDLCMKIGEGDLRRSDIVFSIPRDLRVAIEKVVHETGKLSPNFIARKLQEQGIEVDRVDVSIYLNYRKARVVLGDMYELVRGIELTLHRFLKDALIAEFGEADWWRSGVPDYIRADCAALREKDREPADDSYSYTHLINLREIFDKKWSIISNYMPKRLVSEKRELLDRLLKLNRIRNAVMHPVKQVQFTEDEFEFVHDLSADVAKLKVEAKPAEHKHTAKDQDGTELVTAPTPVQTQKPAPEDATTSEQARPTDPPAVRDKEDIGEEFVPTLKTA